MTSRQTVCQFAGSPEAEGKAEYIMAVIETINQWQGTTIGLAKFFSLARGKLQRHRIGIREVHAEQSQQLWNRQMRLWSLAYQAVRIGHKTLLSAIYQALPFPCLIQTAACRRS